MSLTVDAWNALMKSFLDELCDTLEDVPSVHAARAAFNVAVLGDKEGIMKEYMRLVEPFAQRMHARDVTLIDDGVLGSLDVFKGCDFKKIWHEELDKDTQEAIWNYLTHLHGIGQTCTMLPKELMPGVENVARNLGELIKNGEFDPASLDVSSVGNMLAKEFGNDTELGKNLSEAARALQDPNSEESKQAQLIQAMLATSMPPAK
jgi:hypothetical protein